MLRMIPLVEFIAASHIAVTLMLFSLSKFSMIWALCLVSTSTTDPSSLNASEIGIVCRFPELYLHFNVI